MMHHLEVSMLYRCMLQNAFGAPEIHLPFGYLERIPFLQLVEMHQGECEPSYFHLCLQY